MKSITAKEFAQDIMKFGSCYIGNQDIMGWAYIQKNINKIKKYMKENGLPEVWFYHNEKENSWYANI